MVIRVFGSGVVLLVDVWDIFTRIDLVPPNLLHKHLLPHPEHHRKPPQHIFLEHPGILNPHNIPLDPSILPLIPAPTLITVIPPLETNALLPLTAAAATRNTFIWDI